MTAKELAEKIIRELDCDSCQGHVRSYPESMAKLESLLSAALEEANTKSDKFWRTYWQDCPKTEMMEEAKAAAYGQGLADQQKTCARECSNRRAEAYEDAAKMAESGDCDVELWDAQAKATAESIARLIRAKAESLNV